MDDLIGKRFDPHPGSITAAPGQLGRIVSADIVARTKEPTYNRVPVCGDGKLFYSIIDNCLLSRVTTAFQETGEVAKLSGIYLTMTKLFNTQLKKWRARIVQTRAGSDRTTAMTRAPVWRAALVAPHCRRSRSCPRDAGCGHRRGARLERTHSPIIEDRLGCGLCREA